MQRYIDELRLLQAIRLSVVATDRHGIITFVNEAGDDRDEIQPGDELVEETFARLIPRREVVAYPYEGFFGPMDTIKDRQRLESLLDSGSAPWRMVGVYAERAERS